MPADPAELDSYRERNDASRARLHALVERLTTDDLARDLGSGWSVAAALAHMGYWDRRSAHLIRRAAEGLWVPDAATAPAWLDDVVNDTLLPEWQGLPPAEAAHLAIDGAEMVDTAAAAVSPELTAEILLHDETWTLRRYRHRDEHLDQIEGILGRP